MIADYVSFLFTDSCLLWLALAFPGLKSQLVSDDEPCFYLSSDREKVFNFLSKILVFAKQYEDDSKWCVENALKLK